MKSHTIIVNGTDPKGILQNSLDGWGKDFTYQFVDETKISNVWNNLSSSKTTLVVSDYLIETIEHANVVRRFIDSFQNKKGSKFYSPRPNSFMPTNKAYIYGSTEKIKNSISVKKKLRKTVLNLARSLPDPIKNNLKKVRKNLKSIFYTFKTSNNSTQNIIDSDKYSPKMLVPSSISSIPVNWIDWRDETALHHDLLDRNYLFYPYPSSMHVAVLNTCNLKCVMCPFHSPKYKEYHKSGFFDDKKSLSMDTFLPLAEYAGKNKINLQFGQIEETLQHPQIFDFISTAKMKGVPYIHLTTNGTTMSRKRAESLASSGVDSVMFSVDSVDPETYKKIRGASLEKLERNIEYFLPLAKKNGIKVMCSFIRQEPALSQRDAFLEKWKSKGVDQVSFYVLTENELETGEMIRTEQFRYSKDRYACGDPWVSTAIMPDGSVSLCCKTMSDVGWKYMSVGNIKFQGFDEIWESEHYRNVRKELLLNKFEKGSSCEKCLIWSATTSFTDYGKDYVRVFNETMETYTFN